MLILSKSIDGLRYQPKISCSFHSLLFLSKKAWIFHGGCYMNHIVKIQSWTGLLGKNRIFLSIFYHFVVIFVQKVNFVVFRGAILGLYIWQHEHIWPLAHSWAQLLSIQWEIPSFLGTWRVLLCSNQIKSFLAIFGHFWLLLEIYKYSRTL